MKAGRAGGEGEEIKIAGKRPEWKSQHTSFIRNIIHSHSEYCYIPQEMKQAVANQANPCRQRWSMLTVLFTKFHHTDDRWKFITACTLWIWAFNIIRFQLSLVWKLELTDFFSFLIKRNWSPMQPPKEHFYVFYIEYLQYECLCSIYFGNSVWKSPG